MTWILTTILCVVLMEFVIRIPLTAVISEINAVIRKSLYTLGAKSVSDHWKEKVMLAYAGLLFISAMKLAGFLVAVVAMAILLIVVFDYLGANISDFITSWAGILFSTIVATIYFRVRKSFA